jgi:hypothetical protein
VTEILIKLHNEELHNFHSSDIMKVITSRRMRWAGHLALLEVYLGVLISIWLFLFPIFLFAAQRKEFFLDGLKKLEQRSHKCVELREEYVQ